MVSTMVRALADRDQLVLDGGLAHLAALPADLAAGFLVESAPDPCVLAGLQRPFKAVGANRTAEANRDRSLGLGNGWSRGADREEQLGIFSYATALLDPGHLFRVSSEPGLDHDPPGSVPWGPEGERSG